MFSKYIFGIAISSVMLLSACGGGDSSSTTANYVGTYKGTTTGVNVGSLTINVASDHTLVADWTITNRNPPIIAATLKGNVNASDGTVRATGYIGVNPLSTFVGSINANTGVMSGNWYENNEPQKGGTFTAQK